MVRGDFHDILAKLRPVIGETADALWLTALLDPSRHEDVRAVARAMAAELLGEDYARQHLLLEPPSRHQAAGDYTLGWVTYAGKRACPFGLREGELAQHLAILGRSGAGKSNIGYLLVWNLLRAGKPFIVLDWRRNYRHFRFRPEGKDILIFSLGEPESLSFNPLDPPGNLTQSQREAYLRDILSSICTTYLPGFHLLSTRGVEYFLLKALGHFGIISGKPATFNDIKAYLDKYRPRSRERDWTASAQNVLLKLTTGPIGTIFNQPGEAGITDILHSPVILELDGLGSQTDRVAFTKALLLWLFYYRLAEGRASSAFKHALIIEEAHHLFLRTPGQDQSTHDLMLRQMRDLGQALILMDQNPSLLSTPSLGNTGVTICLNLKHADDLEAAGKALALPRDRREHIARLPAGQGIVKVPDRFPTPFLVRFPLFPVTERPSQPRGKTGQTDSPVARPLELRTAMNEAIRPLRGTDTRKRETSRIPDRERQLLLDIAEHPLSTVTERYKRLGWTAHTGTKVKKALLKRGLTVQEDLPVPEGKVSLLQITPEGKDLLQSWRVPVKPFPKNASLEHEYWRHRIAEDYRSRGYEVGEEVPVGGGRTVDLVASKDGERIAMEIETGKSDAEANRRKCEEAGFNEMVVMDRSRSTLQTEKVLLKTILRAEEDQRSR